MEFHSTKRLVGAVFSIGLPVALWFAPIRLDITEKHALAIASFMIIAWITEVLPHAVTGIIGCYLFWVLKVVGFESAFSGYAGPNTMVSFRSGTYRNYGDEVGFSSTAGLPWSRTRVGVGYSRLLLGFILSSFLLTFLVPSGIACVIIMASIALGLMEVFGLSRGSSVGRGISILR